VTSFLPLFPLGALAMPFMFLAFFAMTAVHAVAEEVHGDKNDKEYDEDPIFSDPFHKNTSLGLTFILFHLWT